MDGWSKLVRGVNDQELAAARREGVLEAARYARSLSTICGSPEAEKVLLDLAETLERGEHRRGDAKIRARARREGVLEGLRRGGAVARSAHREGVIEGLELAIRLIDDAAEAESDTSGRDLIRAEIERLRAKGGA